MTGRTNNVRSRVLHESRRSRTRLARVFAAACLLFPLAAALPVAAQGGGKDGTYADLIATGRRS